MEKKVDLSLIVAMTPKGLIGNNGGLPWRLPSDLAHFKKVTLEAGTVIMGRPTYHSILAHNGKPLSGREHVVLTRKTLLSSHRSVHFVGSIEEMWAEVKAHGNRACVIGGGEVYKLFLSLAHIRRMHVTLVHSPELSGDVYFPATLEEIEAGWKCVEATPVSKGHPADEYETSFRVYERLQSCSKENGASS